MMPRIRFVWGARSSLANFCGFVSSFGFVSTCDLVSFCGLGSSGKVVVAATEVCAGSLAPVDELGQAGGSRGADGEMVGDDCAIKRPADNRMQRIASAAKRSQREARLARNSVGQRRCRL